MAKSYIENSSVFNLDFKQSVRAATVSNITLSGIQQIDGISLSVGDRVLVKNQSSAAQNGIYVVKSGVWSRSQDANNSSNLNSGLIVFVEEGSINSSSNWQLTTVNPIILGSTNLVFSKTGERGLAGETGPQGPQGPQGEPGPAGDPATATTDASALTTGTLNDARLSGNVVLTNDARLTNARTPTSHASSHTAAGSDPLEISASQVSGLAAVATSGSAASLETGKLPDARLSENVTLNANLRWAMQTTPTCIDWVPRGHGTIGAANAASGTLILSFFTAPYSFTSTTLTFATSNTATAGLSLVRFGLFAVSETITDNITFTTPTVTLVARTASDTTIGNSTNTFYSRTFNTTGGYPASYNIVAGTRYAAGLILVGTTVGNWQAATLGLGALMRLPPMVAGQVAGLSDIPTSPQNVATGTFVLWGRIS